MSLPPPRKIIKAVSRFIVARAVSTSISLIIEKNTEPETKLEQASVYVGSFVLGEWAADAIKPYVDKQIDDAAEMFAKSEPEIPETPAS